jgi:hypothetical protein
MAKPKRKNRRAGRGAEVIGLHRQIHGLLIALVGCCAALGAILVLPAEFTLIVLLLLGVSFHYARGVYNRSDTWMRGSAGEREVGAALEELEATGWSTRHDVMKSTGGNIDHVVAGPGGIFAIETKLHQFGKPGIRQAHAHARYLRKLMKTHVVPIICLANKTSPPKVYADVWCMGRPHLAQFLRDQPPRPVNPEILARLAD